MNKTLVLESPGKVNFGLQVFAQRDDGYHNIHTVFQELSFPDRIEIKTRRKGWSLACNRPDVPVDETNICIRALELLQERYPGMGGADFHLEKTIPTGAGLGGGSANGAKALTGLNEVYSLGLTSEELENIGALLGADVPFFIKGGTQVGDGVGEILTPCEKAVGNRFLLVIPPFKIDTAWAYRTLKNHLDTTNRPRNFASLLNKEKIPLTVFENDFEKIVIPAHPEIGEIKKALMKNGAVFSGLSGSGSTVYGIFDDETSALEAESEIKSVYNTVLTVPTNL